MSDWAQIKPDAGVLVEDRRGEWRTVRTVFDRPDPLPGLPGPDIWFDYERNALGIYECKPLLPSCTMDEAWDALKAISEPMGSDAAGDYMRYIPVDVPTPAVAGNSIHLHRYVNADHQVEITASCTLSYYVPAHDAACDATRQRLGALRTWLSGVAQRSKA